MPGNITPPLNSLLIFTKSIVVIDEAEMIIQSQFLFFVPTALIILSEPTSLGFSHLILIPVFTPADISIGSFPVIFLEIFSYISLNFGTTLEIIILSMFAISLKTPNLVKLLSMSIASNIISSIY